MKEASVSLGVRPLAAELDDPRRPELQKVDWTAEITGVAGKPVVTLTHPKRGRVVQSVVRALMGDGRIGIWDQPVFYENPGAIFAPFRYKRSGKAEKADRVTLYMIMIQRPVVKSCLNLPETANIGEEDSGVMSVEFPRGISDDLKKSGFEFLLSQTHRMERMSLLGDQGMFDAAGGMDEFAEEVPTLTVLPGAAPILVGGCNANTTYFGTTQGGFVIPISPRQNLGLDQAGGSAVQREFISGLVPLQFPEETDRLLEETARIMSTGVWSKQTPVLIDDFTIAMLTHIGRLLRQGRLPITG